MRHRFVWSANCYSKSGCPSRHRINSKCESCLLKKQNNCYQLVFVAIKLCKEELKLINNYVFHWYIFKLNGNNQEVLLYIKVVLIESIHWQWKSKITSIQNNTIEIKKQLFRRCSDTLEPESNPVKVHSKHLELRLHSQQRNTLLILVQSTPKNKLQNKEQISNITLIPNHRHIDETITDPRGLESSEGLDALLDIILIDLLQIMLVSHRVTV